MYPSTWILLNRKTIYNLVVLLTVLFVTLGVQGTPYASAQEISGEEPTGALVNLSTRNNKAFFGAAEEVILQVSITNPNAYSIKILKWLTPLDGVEGPLFTVLRDGTPVEYLGPVYKRAAPTDQDYITVAAGESLTGDVYLSALYDFSTSGNYEITFEVTSDKLYFEDRQERKKLHQTGSLLSNTLEMVVEEHKAPAPPEIEVQSVTGSTSFNGCTASRQTDLINARASASVYANEAVTYFTANNPGLRYTTWFGTYDLTRYNTVSSHFGAIRNAMDSASMLFDCTCTLSSEYAYVYPKAPYKIYLCNAFWSAPLTGTDSKAGTLIHETSHFNVVATTRDYAYGQSASQALAVNNPAQAIMNADSHEYFAENTPPIEHGTFADVPANHWAWQHIESIYNASITGGCSTSPLMYCPDSAVTRAQMAVFLEKGIHGSTFSPPNVAPTFNDTIGNWAEDWIEAFKEDGITSGCGPGLYCPETSITRAQMAVFLLRSKHGASYSPPPATGTMFGDVPANHWAAAWIERLAAEGITSGCDGSNYCPDSSVTRAQMAVFLQRTFNLTLP